MVIKLRRGQSTLEYVIILAAVVGAIIAVGVMLRPRLETTYTTLTDTAAAKVATVTF